MLWAGLHMTLYVRACSNGNWGLHLFTLFLMPQKGYVEGSAQSSMTKTGTSDSPKVEPCVGLTTTQADNERFLPNGGSSRRGSFGPCCPRHYWRGSLRVTVELPFIIITQLGLWLSNHSFTLGMKIHTKTAADWRAAFLGNMLGILSPLWEQLLFLRLLNFHDCSSESEKPCTVSVPLVAWDNSHLLWYYLPGQPHPWGQVEINIKSSRLVRGTHLCSPTCLYQQQLFILLELN